jgi:hypothetical protein
MNTLTDLSKSAKRFSFRGIFHRRRMKALSGKSDACFFILLMHSFYFLNKEKTRWKKWSGGLEKTEEEPLMTDACAIPPFIMDQNREKFWTDDAALTGGRFFRAMGKD